MTMFAESRSRRADSAECIIPGFYSHLPFYPQVTERNILRSVYTLRIMKEQKTFIRRIKQGDRTRYAEVWNERRGKRVIQHHVRYLGSDPDDPAHQCTYDIEPAQFEYLAGRMVDGTLTAENVRAVLALSDGTIERKGIREVALKYSLEDGRMRIRLVFPRNVEDRPEVGSG